MGLIDAFLNGAEDIADNLDQAILGTSNKELFDEDIKNARPLKLEWEDAVIKAKERAKALNRKEVDYTDADPLLKKYRDKRNRAYRYYDGDELKRAYKILEEDISDINSMVDDPNRSYTQREYDTYLKESMENVAKLEASKKEDRKELTKSLVGWEVQTPEQQKLIDGVIKYMKAHGKTLEDLKRYKPDHYKAMVGTGNSEDADAAFNKMLAYDYTLRDQGMSAGTNRQRPPTNNNSMQAGLGTKKLNIYDDLASKGVFSNGGTQ